MVERYNSEELRDLAAALVAASVGKRLLHIISNDI